MNLLRLLQSDLQQAEQRAIQSIARLKEVEELLESTTREAFMEAGKVQYLRAVVAVAEKEQQQPSPPTEQSDADAAK